MLAEKVVNCYIIPSLMDGYLFNMVTKQTRCLVFTYRVFDDHFKSKGVYSFRRLKKQVS